MSTPPPVSVHGGHSGQFCSHARDTLAEIVDAYIENGFPWVGITEHMPAPSDRFAYPEELAAGLDAGAQYDRFADYIHICRRLQAINRDRIRILVGFETETYSDSHDWIRRLIDTFAPDYIVGSAHHVDDMPFDIDASAYAAAADRAGGLDTLYMRYFDQQYEMIRRLKPQVVGHLDIIRIHDAEYPTRILKPAIWQRISRNLELIASLGLILDFNLRPLSKGATEPYPTAPILEAAIGMGIHIVPGDDSHGVKDIATKIYTGIDILRSAGYRCTTWREPARSHTSC